MRWEVMQVVVVPSNDLFMVMLHFSHVQLTVRIFFVRHRSLSNAFCMMQPNVHSIAAFIDHGGVI